jgi:ParB-like chromosome segregation protein Spo0J
MPQFAREAHDRLVTLIGAHGLLRPLVVRPAQDKPKYFQVIASDRRLAALKEVHRNTATGRSRAS